MKTLIALALVLAPNAFAMDLPMPEVPKVDFEYECYAYLEETKVWPSQGNPDEAFHCGDRFSYEFKLDLAALKKLDPENTGSASFHLRDFQWKRMTEDDSGWGLDACSDRAQPEAKSTWIGLHFLSGYDPIRKNYDSYTAHLSAGFSVSEREGSRSVTLTGQSPIFMPYLSLEGYSEAKQGEARQSTNIRVHCIQNKPR